MRKMPLRKEHEMCRETTSRQVPRPGTHCDTAPSAGPWNSLECHEFSLRSFLESKAPLQTAGLVALGNCRVTGVPESGQQGARLHSADATGTLS